MSFFARIVNWRERFRRDSSTEETARETALLPRAMLAMLEDILAWDNLQMSLGFLVFVNIVFVIFIQMSITFTETVFMVGMMALSLDALELWLRHKRRTACLQRLARCDNVRLQRALALVTRWLRTRKDEFLAMREANHTKAFLFANIILGVLFVIGKTISGTLLLYLVSMAILLSPIVSPYVMRVVNKIHQISESDADIDSLIPELSEQNIKELNIETEPVNTRQSVEAWLPEGTPPDDLSDSDSDSRLSASSLPRGAAPDLRDTSDSSDDEYLPQLEDEKLITTVNILPPAPPTWSDTATSALWTLRGALTNLVSRSQAGASQNTNVRKRIPREESSDDFEFVDKSDL